MVGIYIVSFLLFPLSVVMQTRRGGNGNVLLEKEDSSFIRGVAACFVILAHLMDILKEEGMGGSSLLRIFDVTGGMGVLLFFFVSGYGIYKEYSHKKPGVLFWYKRMVNMYFPCILIQFLFCMMNMCRHGNFNMGELLLTSFFGAWFVDVILIQYLLFFLSWVVTRGRSGAMVALCFLLSAAAGMAFLVCGFNARWYNGLLLFPSGMSAAWGENKIISSLEKNWMSHMVLQMTLLLVLGGGFVYWKGEIWANVFKTVAGICLSMLFVTLFRKVKFSSVIMRRIGEQSLFYYIVHMGVISLLKGEMNAVVFFYSVIILTFLGVEIFWRLYGIFRRS